MKPEFYSGYTKPLSADEQRKNEIESIVKLLKSDPTNTYWQSRYNELVIKPIYGENWEADADQLHAVLSGIPDQTCQNCDKGKTECEPMEFYTCPCCNGDWQHCPNCTDGVGNDTADLLADMRGHG